MPCPPWYLDTIELFARTDTKASDLCELRLVKSRLTIMDGTSGIYRWQLFIKHLIQTSFNADNSL